VNELIVWVLEMKKREVVKAIKRGFDGDEEKAKTALIKLGILHWAEKDFKWT